MTELRIKATRRELDNHERLLALQMAGHPVSRCAALLNVSRETCYQWMKNPLYIALRERERVEVLTATADVIIAAALDGVRVLQSIACDFRLPVASRIQAAQILTELGDKLNERQQRNTHEAQLATMLYPEVVPDEPDVKELPATTQRFDELFQQLHEQQPTGE
jgi:K+-sensing histidine kinase KdpD